jgi:hypothetical protein
MTTTQESINSKMNKQDVGYSHNGILFSLTKEGNSVNNTTGMGSEDTILSEIRQSPKDKC